MTWGRTVGVRMNDKVYRGILIALLAVISGGFITAAAILMVRANGNAPIQVITAPPETAEVLPPNPSGPPDSPAELVLHVRGAVSHPGVYGLRPGDRLVDAIDAAGGAAENADLAAVNLAQRVHDEGSYFIPTIGETPPPIVESPTPMLEDNSGPTTSPGRIPLVDLNTASAQELAALPNIGDVRAQAIVGYRAANGLFGSAEEITQVPGIGQGIYQSLRDLVTAQGK